MWETIQPWMHNAYWFVAVCGSVIFVLQFAMTLFGADADGDSFEAEPHDLGDIQGLNFFSFKSIISFVTFFGWGGVIFGGVGLSGLLIAVFSGAVMMFLTALVIWLLLKMQHSGNLSPADAVGHCGRVYLTIPGGRKPGGIVTVSLGDCTRQIAACADRELPGGTEVRIISADGGIYLVEAVKATDKLTENKEN